MALLKESEIFCFSEILIDCIKENRSIICIGNGGSASTAEHFVTDLTLLLKRANQRAKASALSSNSGVITAIGNDLGFDELYSYQLKNYANEKALLIGFSASGNSENIIHAFEEAKNLNFTTVALLGFDGGIVNQIGSDCTILFADVEKDYGIVENLHLLVCHYVIDIVSEHFKMDFACS